MRHILIPWVMRIFFFIASIELFGAASALAQPPAIRPAPPRDEGVRANRAEVVNRHPHLVEVRILAPGKVTEWTETDAAGNARTFRGGLHAGQTLSLEPGDKLHFSTPNHRHGFGKV